MAVYRNISLSFWTDSKIEDNFTPEDKYFYLYLLTNPHTNLCGCYEISKKQIAYETGYNRDTVSRLLDRFSNVLKVICYDGTTNEVLILNWSKYNWTRSQKFLKAVAKDIAMIKNKQFMEYVDNLVKNVDNPNDGYGISDNGYPTDTTVLYCTVTDTVTDTGTVSDEEAKRIIDNARKGWSARKGKG